MNIQNNEKSMLWLKHFKDNKQFSHFRFKIPQSKHYIDIDKDLIDIVDKETFLKIEENRIPLFLGTQFGVYPQYDIKEIAHQSRIIAILGKSLLSGNVSGVTFYKLRKNGACINCESSRKEIIQFENK